VISPRYAIVGHSQGGQAALFAAHYAPAGVAAFAAGYPAVPNEHQQRFNAQLAQMNPAVTIAAPVRITQAADDERVYANPAPLPCH
jgi:pimeloyl-ACP methyl ester carboxylesterase